MPNFCRSVRTFTVLFLTCIYQCFIQKYVQIFKFFNHFNMKTLLPIKVYYFKRLNFNRLSYIFLDYVHFKNSTENFNVLIFCMLKTQVTTHICVVYRVISNSWCKIKGSVQDAATIVYCIGMWGH